MSKNNKPGEKSTKNFPFNNVVTMDDADDPAATVANLPDANFESILKAVVQPDFGNMKKASSPNESATLNDRLVYELKKKADAEGQKADELFTEENFQNIRFDAKKLKKSTSHESYKPFITRKSPNSTSVHVDAAVKFPFVQKRGSSDVYGKSERSYSENEPIMEQDYALSGPDLDLEEQHQHHHQQRYSIIDETVVPQCRIDESLAAGQFGGESELVGEDFKARLFMSVNSKDNNNGGSGGPECEGVEMVNIEEQRKKATLLRNGGGANPDDVITFGLGGVGNNTRRSTSQKSGRYQEYTLQQQNTTGTVYTSNFNELQSTMVTSQRSTVGNYVMPNTTNYGRFSPTSDRRPGGSGRPSGRRNKRSGEEDGSVFTSDQINGFRGSDSLDSLLLYIEGRPKTTNENNNNNKKQPNNNSNNQSADDSASGISKKTRGRKEKEVKKEKAKKASSIGTSCDAGEVDELFIRSPLESMKFLCKSDELPSNNNTANSSVNNVGENSTSSSSYMFSTSSTTTTSATIITTCANNGQSNNDIIVKSRSGGASDIPNQKQPTTTKMTSGELDSVLKLSELDSLTEFINFPANDHFHSAAASTDPMTQAEEQFIPVMSKKQKKLSSDNKRQSHHHYPQQYQQKFCGANKRSITPPARQQHRHFTNTSGTSAASGTTTGTSTSSVVEKSTCSSTIGRHSFNIATVAYPAKNPTAFSAALSSSQSSSSNMTSSNLVLDNWPDLPSTATTTASSSNNSNANNNNDRRKLCSKRSITPPPQSSSQRVKNINVNKVNNSVNNNNSSVNVNNNVVNNNAGTSTSHHAATTPWLDKSQQQEKSIGKQQQHDSQQTTTNGGKDFPLDGKDFPPDGNSFPPLPSAESWPALYTAAPAPNSNNSSAGTSNDNNHNSTTTMAKNFSAVVTANVSASAESNQKIISAAEKPSSEMMSHRKLSAAHAQDTVVALSGGSGTTNLPVSSSSAPSAAAAAVAAVTMETTQPPTLLAPASTTNDILVQSFTISSTSTMGAAPVGVTTSATAPQRRFSCPPVEFLDKNDNVETEQALNAALQGLTFGCFDDESPPTPPHHLKSSAMHSVDSKKSGTIAAGNSSGNGNSSSIATAAEHEKSRTDAKNNKKFNSSAQRRDRVDSVTDLALMEMVNFVNSRWDDFTSNSADIIWYGK